MASDIIYLEDANSFFVKLYVPHSTLRSISGFKVGGTTTREDDANRHDLVAARDEDGRAQFLNKYFLIEVPKDATGGPNGDGIYNLTAWAGTDKDGNPTKPSSMQVRVTCDEKGVYSIEKIGYGDALEAFGVEPRARQLVSAG